MQANGVGDDQPDKNGPQHVFDIGYSPMVLSGKGIPPDLSVLTQHAHRDQQKNARHILNQPGAGERSLGRRFIEFDASCANPITTGSWAAHRQPPTT
jgi:hypothetical protein